MVAEIIINDNYSNIKGAFEKMAVADFDIVQVVASILSKQTTILGLMIDGK